MFEFTTTTSDMKKSLKDPYSVVDSPLTFNSSFGQNENPLLIGSKKSLANKEQQGEEMK